MFEKLISKKDRFIDSVTANFKASESSRQFPSFSLSIIGGLSLILSKKKYRSILFSPITFIKHGILENSQIQILEPQNVQKPTILFDFKNFLYTDKFSIHRFDMVFLKRYFCEEFLFNIAHYYEIVSITDGLPAISNTVLSKIDPFGCIKYRIYLENKKDFEAYHLNRDLSKLIAISTSEDEFHESFSENTLRISPFKDQGDTKLTDMMHFLINLHYSNDKKDFRTILKSYRNVDFFVSFRDIQKRLFSQRNLLSFNRFETQLQKINQEKIIEYAEFKNKVKVPNHEITDLKNTIFNFFRTAVL